MFLFKLIALTLISASVNAQTIFSPADARDATAGMSYDETQPEVLNAQEFQGKTVAILAAHGVQDIELTYPYKYLTNRGAKVDILIPSWAEGKVMGVSYIKPTIWIKGTKTFFEARQDKYDLVVLTGGSWNSNVVRKDADAIKFIKSQHERGGLISAVCSGVQILIDAEMTLNTKLTGTGSIAIDLKNAGAIYQNLPAVIDGNIITGRGPAEMKEFMSAIHSRL